MKKNKFNRSQLFVLLFAILLLAGCRGKSQKGGETLSTTTSGEINIVADATLKPIVDAEVNVFESIYKDAKLNVRYVSESEAMAQFMKDSAVLAVLTRPLTKAEVAMVKKQKVYPSKTKIGIGAIALITNKNNPDSLITMDQVRALFKGEITQWKEMNPKSPLAKIQIIFSNQNASTVRFIKDSIADGKLPPNSYAEESNGKVIDYVSKNENAMGIIGVSWISDRDDPQALGFLGRIRVMGISKAGSKFHQPYQAYIAQGTYPLIRDIYLVSREPRSGLATGFMAFAAGSKGQRIVLKMGLVPASMPVRIIQFKEKNKN